MFTHVVFNNYRALRDAELRLGRFTLLIGPNGSGKSTAFDALRSLRNIDTHRCDHANLVSADLRAQDASAQGVSIEVRWHEVQAVHRVCIRWTPSSQRKVEIGPVPQSGTVLSGEDGRFRAALAGIRHFSLQAEGILQPNELLPGELELTEQGVGLARALDQLRDKHPERFEALNEELNAWFPEFDRFLFDTPRQGARSFQLRTSDSKQPIAASDLSHGMLLALAILFLRHSPVRPSLICMEEPDRGLHPRLLRRVADALFALSQPRSDALDASPTQVLVTSHSPYFLDLFRDRPECVVIAEKAGIYATFKQLSRHPHITEILGDAPLGEVWYSGVLGGVPEPR